LINSELYFALPKHLNDPFDCNINISNSILRVLSEWQSESLITEFLRSGTIADRIQKLTRTMGVCSFSLVSEEVLMWSHYANNHTGVCLCYEIPGTFIDFETNKIVGVSEVSYNENGLTEWIFNNIESYKEQPQEFAIEFHKRYLTAKSPSWSYEKEVRILRKECGAFELPREYLKQICFGLQTSDQDQRLISRIVDNYYSDVSLCKIERGQSDFGLYANEL
jgi:hypothetical protein